MRRHVRPQLTHQRETTQVARSGCHGIPRAHEPSKDTTCTCHCADWRRRGKKCSPGNYSGLWVKHVGKDTVKELEECVVRPNGTSVARVKNGARVHLFPRASPVPWAPPSGRVPFQLALHFSPAPAARSAVCFEVRKKRLCHHTMGEIGHRFCEAVILDFLITWKRQKIAEIEPNIIQTEKRKG